MWLRPDGREAHLNSFLRVVGVLEEFDELARVVVELGPERGRVFHEGFFGPADLVQSCLEVEVLEVALYGGEVARHR